MLISFKHFRRFFSKPPKGFTLVELIVVSTIILLISVFIFFQQSKFNSSTILRSLTYSVALSVRQAQVYGTSVRESSPGSGIFGQGYGVYIPSAGTATDNTYYMFSDNNGDGAYTSGEELPVYRLGTGYRISAVCAVAVGGSTCNALTSLTVYFRRPNPDACISSAVSPAACALGATEVYSRAYITVGNGGNTDSRSIKVTDTGQIAVCAPNLADVTTC